jgi:predicted phosphodiesterase
MIPIFERLEPREYLSGLTFGLQDLTGVDLINIKYADVFTGSNQVQEGDVIDKIDRIVSQNPLKTSSVKIKNLGGGDGITELDNADIVGNSTKLTFYSSIVGGNFNFDYLSSFKVKGNATNININARQIGKCYVYGNLTDSLISSDANINKVYIKGTLANTSVQAGGELKTVKLSSAEYSDFLAASIKSFKAKGNIFNTSIVTNGIYNTIGKITLGSYFADAPNKILGMGPFSVKIGYEKFTASQSLKYFGTATVECIIPPIPASIPGVDYSFAILSDPHTKPNPNVVEMTAANDPFVTFFTGDIISRTSTPYEDWDLLLERIQPISDVSEIMPVVGNHDYNSFQAYLDTWGEDKAQYAFESDGVQHIVVNSSVDYSPGSENYNWVKDILNQSECPLVAVYSHHKSLVTGDLLPLLQNYENQEDKDVITFSGHTHRYSHSNKDGIDFMVTGTNHFAQVLVDFDTSTFEIRTIDGNNNASRSFII